MIAASCCLIQSHIERVDFSRTQGFNDNDVTSQGREYQGLMTAEDHRHKKEELDRILAWKVGSLLLLGGELI
eukprot:SAG31_NODE_134_length_23213_cov_5.698624_14_plen_72_part_00